MIEPRRELGLAHETPQDDVVAAQSLVKHLDDGFAAQQRLVAAIHRTESTFADSLAKDEVANHSPAKILAFPHPAPTYH
jgi:hypothetical protein